MTTAWTTCIKITRRDTTVIGLTDLDVDLTISGVTYKSAAGYTPTTLSASSDMSVDTADVEGILAAAGVEREDIRAGLYDRAEVEWFLYDWENEATVKTLAKGHWGEATLYEGRYVAEVRSLSQHLQETVGEVTTPTCRADLGDSRCGVNLATYQEAVTLTGVTSASVFTDTARTEAANYWRGGKITFTSGANDGFSMEVKSSTAGGQFTLFQPMPFTPSIGDTATIVPGCNKLPNTCKNTYSNYDNFRGEPHVPGRRKVSQRAGQ